MKIKIEIDSRDLRDYTKHSHSALCSKNQREII